MSQLARNSGGCQKLVARGHLPSGILRENNYHDRWQGRESAAMRLTRGSCLCGAVTYEIKGPLRQVIACHCGQCRKAMGHYAAATQALAEDMVILGDTLKWYKSSETAERGFCSNCGGNLFWRRFGNAHLSIWAGTIDGPTGLRMESQLYADSAADYYDVPDLPNLAQSALK
jgi:hypothetical protein